MKDNPTKAEWKARYETMHGSFTLACERLEAVEAVLDKLVKAYRAIENTSDLLPGDKRRALDAALLSAESFISRR